MATNPLGYTLHTKHCMPFHSLKPAARTNPCLSCRSSLSAGPPGSGGEKREKGGRKEERRHRGFVELFGKAERVAGRLKESLSPKHKGDWKDLLLMSFSFAVYVYISQKMVCAYCAWMSMLKHY